MPRRKSLTPKKKKDFKLSEEIVLEFERLAPGGKQTAIVEDLIAGWIREQKRKERTASAIRAYEKDAKS